MRPIRRIRQRQIDIKLVVTLILLVAIGVLLLWPRSYQPAEPVQIVHQWCGRCGGTFSPQRLPDGRYLVTYISAESDGTTFIVPKNVAIRILASRNLLIEPDDGSQKISGVLLVEFTFPPHQTR